MEKQTRRSPKLSFDLEKDIQSLVEENVEI